VHGLVGERQQDRRADVAAFGARPGTSAVAGTAEPGAVTMTGTEPGAVTVATSAALAFALALAAAFAGAARAESTLAALAAGAVGTPAAPLTFTVRSAPAALHLV
jgi:hypothetical protein